MLFWSITLRAIGTVYFVWTTAAQVYGLNHTWGTRDTFITTILQSAVLAALCFGLAAGLHHLERLDERTTRHSTALKLLLPPSRRKSYDSDLAPEAPRNWVEFKPRPFDPTRDKDSGYEQRMARRWRYAPRPPRDHVR